MLQLRNHQLRRKLISLSGRSSTLCIAARMSHRRLLERPRPVHDRFRNQTCMRHLCDQASDVFVLDLLEVGVREENARDDVFLAFDLDVVADIVGVFAEAEDARVDEFGDGTRKGKGETDDARPEGPDVGANVFVGEEDD